MSETKVFLVIFPSS